MEGLTFIIMFLVLMALIAVVPFWMRRLNVPGIVAIMLVGILIGPHALDLLQRLNSVLGRGFPTGDLYLVVDVMGLLGLIFLMALAGMEADLNLIRREKQAVKWLSVLTFAVPGAMGFLVYYAFEPCDHIGQLLYASLFASHSIGIVFPILRELNVVQTRFGISILASTVATDISSLLLLAVCVQLKRHAMPGRLADSISIFDNMSPGGWGILFYVLFIAAVIAYMVIAVWLVPKAGRPLFNRIGPNDDIRLTFFLFGVLAVVFMGELIGVNVVVGAFIGGMALARIQGIHQDDDILHRKLEGLGYGLLVPFLFLSIGMKTNVPILFEAWDNIAIVLATVTGLVGSKVGAGWLAMRLSGFDNLKGLCAGLMTVPQLTATLAAATVALDLNIITTPFFNAIVCLSIVTTLPVPTLVRFLIVKGKIQFDPAEGA